MADFSGPPHALKSEIQWNLIGLTAAPQVANFSPTIPARMSPMQESRSAVAGSPKSQMPKSAVPVAPMPVQTA